MSSAGPIPTLESAIADRERGYLFVDEFSVAHRSDPITWVLAPLLRTLYQRLTSHPVGRRRLRMRSGVEAVANYPYAALKPSAARYSLCGPALFCLDSPSCEWACGPIIEAGRQRGNGVAAAAARISPLRLRRWNRRALALAREFTEALTAEGIPGPCSRAWLLRHFLGVARYLAHAENLLDRWEPDVVVVGTNHNKAARALLWTAHARGVSSVLIPHAPMITAPRIWDLPVHYAALRGRGDAAVYEALGVAAESLAVVGDPGLGDDDGLLHGLDAEAIAFALPPLREDQTRQAVEVVAGAAGDRKVVVTPHPSHPLEDVRRFCPPEWPIWEGRSRDHLLQAGPGALIQHSSGLALEALMLGVPTIQLSLTGWSENYMAIDPAIVRFAERTIELEDALTWARTTAGDPTGREQLRTWGRRWCDATGDEAGRRGWDLVAAAALTPRTGPAWDLWSDIPRAREVDRRAAAIVESARSGGAGALGSMARPC